MVVRTTLRRDSETREIDGGGGGRHRHHHPKKKKVTMIGDMDSKGEEEEEEEEERKTLHPFISQLTVIECGMYTHMRV